MGVLRLPRRVLVSPTPPGTPQEYPSLGCPFNATTTRQRMYLPVVHSRVTVGMHSLYPRVWMLAWAVVACACFRYEGTVWNDLAHGRGVYTTPSELCK